MSASLVGSEMCIRDSAALFAYCTIVLEPLETPDLRMAVEHRNPRACGPVSYTHLTLPTICSV
eukprot:3264355-Alexandrium_andersonii.AAC.1